MTARRSGSADLPLHGGRVPRWLGERMTRLGAVIAEAIVIEYGRDEFLRRLAHPFWFQSFGAVMGMDWHSSGITTSVVGALKRGLNPLAPRPARLRRPRRALADDPARTRRDRREGRLRRGELATASRLVAKVDSAAVQDGFDLYLHGFIVADDGRWVVVQQGMNGDSRKARRYHWLSEGLKSFVEEPHSAIDGDRRGVIVNLTDARAEASRRRQIDLLDDLGPDRIAREIARIERAAKPAEPPTQPLLPHLVMPAHHDVRAEDIVDAQAARQSRGRRRPRPQGFRRASARARGRRAHRARARPGRGSGAWRALPVQRSRPGSRSPTAARTATRIPSR